MNAPLPSAREVVQHTFENDIWPRRHEFGGAFYANLFRAAPDAEKLFPPDGEHQTDKLMLFLRVGIQSLGAVENVAPLLRDLGARHVDYGVMDAHYDQAENAFIATLHEFLNDGLPPVIEQAWRDAYRTLTTPMREAAAARQSRDQE